jgi:uncharacterized membrane-anchored protein
VTSGGAATGVRAVSTANAIAWYEMTMGLREVAFLTLSFSAVAVAEGDTKPDQTTPAKSAPAERSDPETPDSAADQPAKPGDEGSEPLPPHVVGPKRVDLGNSTAIDLPDGLVLFEGTVARDLLRKGGDPDDGVVAIVFKPGSKWEVIIGYSNSGYIDDSDANDLDADELLDAFRSGTAEQNKKRKAIGQAELAIDGWTEKPRYDPAKHHLVWGVAAHDVDGKVVNFFTRILGRSGFVLVNLIDAPERMEASKQEALAILQATHFNPGSTYADHVSSDRSSGLGLRGLVLGGAGVAVASKLGLLAKILLVFKKLFIVVFAVIGGFLRWLFRRKSRAQDADPHAGHVPQDLTGARPPGAALQVDAPTSTPLPPIDDGSA